MRFFCFAQQMSGSRPVRCRQNASHKDFERKVGQCSCGSALEAACSLCDKYFSYGHVKAHEAKRNCLGSQVDEPPELVNFAYWASNWELNGETAFAVGPRGQLWDGLPKGCPKKHGLRVHRVKDPSMKGMEWMDAYDAVYAHIAADPSFNLVKVFHRWADVADAVEGILSGGKSSLKGVDVLVVGNWVHQVSLGQTSLDVPLQWLERLRTFELLSGCRVFPPIDYCISFARKEIGWQLQERCVSHAPHGRPIPTMVVCPASDAGWRERACAFAKEHAAQRLVFKRSVSECKRDVEVVDVKRLETLALSPGNLCWIVQPFIAEFATHTELRLYIVEGKFLFGVSSIFGEGGSEMSLFPFGPGRRDGEWDERAVQLAENVVSKVSQHQAHAARFMRVDMVRCSNGGWFVNELEYFGNAYLHFEVIDDSYEAFPTLVACVKSWMRK